jgi:hypothetical protein
MKNPILPSAFILLFTAVAFSQEKKVSKDFNGDAVIDQVSILEDGGSAFSSTRVNYRDGKTKKSYEFSVLYSFGSFFAIGNAPNILGKHGFGQMGINLFNGKQASAIDPSLQWLIDGASNNGIIRLSEHIDFATRYNPVWVKGNPVIPDNYFVVLENSKYPNLLKNVEGSHEYDGKTYTSDHFWLTYNPHNHKGKRGEFSTLEIDSTHQLLSTTHGVVLKKGGKYSWVFINDNKLFEASDKLRWHSIAEVQMLNGFVLINQSINSRTVNLFIVNPVSGIVVRLNKEFIKLDTIEKMVIDKLKETVELSGSADNKYTLSLQTINEIFRKCAQ